MNEFARAYAIGAVSGSRTMLAPALVANRRLSAVPRWLSAAMAVGEMVADKSDRIPARTTALPLAGRLFSGAVAAAAQAAPKRRLRAAAIGAAGALTGAYVAYHLRRLAVARGVPDAVAGLTEDAVALTAGMLLIWR